MKEAMERLHEEAVSHGVLLEKITKEYVCL